MCANIKIKRLPSIKLRFTLSNRFGISVRDGLVVQLLLLLMLVTYTYVSEGILDRIGCCAMVKALFLSRHCVMTSAVVIIVRNGRHNGTV